MDNLGLLKVSCILPVHTKEHKSSQVLINRALKQYHKVIYIQIILLSSLDYYLSSSSFPFFSLPVSLLFIFTLFPFLPVLYILYLFPISYSLRRFPLFLLLFTILPTKQKELSIKNTVKR